jgi:hypothetical protein
MYFCISFKVSVVAFCLRAQSLYCPTVSTSLPAIAGNDPSSGGTSCSHGSSKIALTTGGLLLIIGVGNVEQPCRSKDTLIKVNTTHTFILFNIFNYFLSFNLILNPSFGSVV